MKTTVKIKILDEVNCVLVGLKKHDIDFFYDLYGVYTKGYAFDIRYKLRKWDGKIRFFKKTCQTYVKLLPEIIPHLKRMNYDLKLIDKRANVELTIPEINKYYMKDKGYDIILGDHQVRGINALTGNAGGIFEGGTGAGKTLMTAVLCHLYGDYHGFRCIVIVPTSDLVQQTYDEMVKWGVDSGIYSGTKKNINHEHLVTTWQSLQNNKPLISQYQVVIVDECHGVTGNVLQDILNNHGSKCLVRIGVTGTIPKAPIEAMAVKITLGEVIEKVEAYELMKNGWLAQLNLYVYELVEDLREQYQEFCRDNPDKVETVSYTKFKNEFSIDFPFEKRYLQKKTDRIQFISKIIKKACEKEKGNSLILVPNVEYGKKITKEIDGIFIHGKDHTKLRKEIYNSFDDNDDITIITTYRLASTGLNIKRIFNLFLIDANKGYVEVIQSIGRGLRKAHDKDKVNCYDIHGDLKYGKKHAAERKRHYNEKKYAFKASKVDYSNF